MYILISVLELDNLFGNYILLFCLFKKNIKIVKYILKRYLVFFLFILLKLYWKDWFINIYGLYGFSYILMYEDIFF